ncbi:MAG: hypothetical protein A2Y40_07475 [Candidatus Margulisbacteria bacterium GWF2_35_9]|nr:MAG: hypothetical protein A2Y40_07475 [Candidatus Margulisbacteria bacterium GWF2_35_9]
MPKYHYRCEKCLNEFEEVQRITDEALKSCPKCNSSIYRVISSNVGVSFKGGGFHINDYQGKNNSITTTPAVPPEKKTKEDSPASNKKETKKKNNVSDKN